MHPRERELREKLNKAQIHSDIVSSETDGDNPEKWRAWDRLEAAERELSIYLAKETRG